MCMKMTMLCSSTCVCSSFFFFFSSRRRHTRCLSDWSSDVCSSDLTTVYADATDAITRAKDLALDRNGSLYVADRESFGGGEVREIQPSGATVQRVHTNESRGLCPDSFTSRLLVAQWNGMGFAGTVDRLDLSTNSLSPIAGFGGMNYSNAEGWGDGDVAEDATGTFYTISEDDWSLVKFQPGLSGPIRIGSSYMNHPSGLAI